ncbi:ParA family protein [Halorubellus sp. PRR65]|uniref:AAA family ATPase n=1 Tax=Halorubellus sp. PRR65 TaxID=3098148 RepID=UPI002B25FEAA|nr:ParA family protein [Halorubellus sp. PRR65]
MSTPRSVAVVGATGGAGATRLVVETAAVLARDGRDVAVFDAAFATQRLAQYVPGDVDVDATRLLTDDAVAPSESLVDLDVDAPGRVAACPVRASFTELADAKTADAAERFDAVVRETADAFDHVLVDVPPVAANQHVAAVTATDRVAVVAPDGRRGADALPRVRDRLRDLDAAAPGDLVVANRVDDPPVVADPAVAVPESDVVDPTDTPVSDTATGAFPSAVAALAERAFDVELDVDLEPTGVTARLFGAE